MPLGITYPHVLATSCHHWQTLKDSDRLRCVLIYADLCEKYELTVEEISDESRVPLIVLRRFNDAWEALATRPDDLPKALDRLTLAIAEMSAVHYFNIGSYCHCSSSQYGLDIFRAALGVI